MFLLQSVQNSVADVEQKAKEKFYAPPLNKWTE
jgi:hypothetical protein